MAETKIVASSGGQLTATLSLPQETGSARQAHVIYAANSARWWLFYLSSSTVLATAYSSDGATWTAGSTFTLSKAASEGGDFSVAYANISSHDVCHILYAPLTTSGGGTRYHIRATISGTSITFSSTTYTPNLSTADNGYSASVAISSTGHIADLANTDGDAWAATWPNADSGTAWTAGTETDTGVRTANSNSIYSFALKSVGGTSFLAVYDDGNTLTSYGSASYGLQWSKYNGTSWGTDTALSGITATNEHINAWGVCQLSESDIHLVHRTGSNSYEHKRFNGTSWASGSSIPTQTSKDSAGCALVSDGTNVWLFVVDSAAGNAVKYIKWNGTAWDASWSTLESTSATRDYLSVCPQVASNTIQVIWQEGSASPYTIAGEQLSVSGSTTSSVNAGASLALKAAGITVAGGAAFALKATNLTQSAAAHLALKQANLTAAAGATLALKAAGLTTAAGAALALKATNVTVAGGAALALKATNLTQIAGASLALKAAGLTQSAAATLALASGTTSSVSAAARLALKATNVTASGGASLALKATNLSRSAGASLALQQTGLTVSGGAALALRAANLSQSAAAHLALKAAGLTVAAGATLALSGGATSSVSAGARLALKAAGLTVPAGASLALKATGLTVASGAAFALKRTNLSTSAAARLALSATLTQAAAASFALRAAGVTQSAGARLALLRAGVTVNAAATLALLAPLPVGYHSPTGTTARRGGLSGGTTRRSGVAATTARHSSGNLTGSTTKE